MLSGGVDSDGGEADLVHSTKHIDENLKDLDKGPLPEDVVKALDEAWEKVRPVTSRYWH